jgi:hypothetical protein
MPHRFDSPLKIDAHGRLARATGPVNDNEEMFWIAAFVYQNIDGHYAAAWGDTGWPRGKAEKWACQTKMAPGSQPFRKGKAQAWALARVSDGGGEFHPWRDEIDLV